MTRSSRTSTWSGAQSDLSGHADRQRACSAALTPHRRILAGRARSRPAAAARAPARRRRAARRRRRPAATRSRVGRAQAQADEELLADLHARDGLALRVEELADDFDALTASPSAGGLRSKPGLVEDVVRGQRAVLENCTFAAVSADRHLRNRAVRAASATRRWPSLPISLMPSVRRGGGGLRVRVERQQRVGRRQRARPVAAHRLADRLERGRRRRAERASGNAATADRATARRGRRRRSRPRRRNRASCAAHGTSAMMRSASSFRCISRYVDARYAAARSVGQACGYRFVSSCSTFDERRRRPDALPRQQIHRVRAQPRVGERARRRRRRIASASR